MIDTTTIEDHAPTTRLRPPRTDDADRRDDVDVIGEDSFPASDPPSWWAGGTS